MPTCYIHGQHYQMDEYCPYCGMPESHTITSTGNPKPTPDNKPLAVEEHERNHI